MSFNNDRVGQPLGMKKECSPDYEAQAKGLKEKLDSNRALREALMSFIDKNETYQFDKISSLAELLGGLTIIGTQQNKNYERVLSMLEKSE